MTSADESDAAVSYKYLPFGARFLRIDQNLAATFTRAPRLFLRHIGARTSLRILLHRHGIRKLLAAPVDLPLKADVCLATQRGFAFFNLSRPSVTHLFHPPLAPDQFAEVDATFRKAAHLPFVPAIIETSHSGQWIEMEYARGKDGRTLLCRNEQEFSRVFESKALPVLKQIAASEPVQRVALSDYTSQLVARLDDDHSLAEWPEARTRLSRFGDQIRARLTEPDTITLGYSHGDFVHLNFIDSPAGMQVIDWDTARLRSFLHDAHTFFFFQLLLGRNVALRRDLLDEFIARLIADFPAQGRPLPLDRPALHAYRRLYYLERLVMILSRISSIGRLNHLCESISMYEAFERAAPGETLHRAGDGDFHLAPCQMVCTLNGGNTP